MNREIALAWTRNFTLPWAEWWQRDMSPRLEEVFGSGVPNQLSYFNGRMLETYRLVEESKAFIQAVVNADPALLGKDKIERYIVLIREIRALIEQTNERGDFFNSEIFETLKTLSSEAYPWYAVSYLLPQEQWAVTLREKYPRESEEILRRLIDARKQSEGTIDELVEYWRAVAQTLLTVRNLPPVYDSFLMFSEMEKMLADAMYAPEPVLLATRSKGYIFFRGSVYTDITKDAFFQAQGFTCAIQSGNDAGQEIKGTVSCSGSSTIRGSVQIILKNDEIKNFKPGNILVTVMTNPFFLPIMKQASAVLTDEGGITCHAAIVSRELNIPCITGTKFATALLKDGDMVEVDAERGIVKKI